MEQFTKTRHSVSIVNTPETVTLQKIGSFKYVVYNVVSCLP